MKPIKILHLTYDMGLGGTEQVIRHLIESSNHKNFIPSIVCLDGKIGPLGKLLQQSGIKIKVFSRNPGFDITLIRQLRSFIKANGIDILHCHQYTPFTYGVLAACLSPVKVVFTEHGRFYPDVVRPKRKLVNPFLAKITDAIVSISKATKSALIEFEFFRGEQIDVIYNGIKDPTVTEQSRLTRLRDDLLLGSDNLILGTVSRLDPIKNQALMLQAFAELLPVFPEIKLLIVGDGPLRSDLENQATKLGIEKSVIFTGFQVNPKMYMELMDIFLLPSLSEGTSMTLLEAMSLKIPCIVTDAGGNPEIVIDKETGLVTPNDNLDEFKSAILKLLSDKSKRIQMGLAGRARYLDVFTVQKMISQYENIYFKILGLKK